MIARPVTWLALAIAALCLVPGVTAVPQLGVPINLAHAGLAYLAIVLARRGRTGAASVVFLAPVVAAFVAAFFLFGGVRGHYALFLPVLICLVGLLRGLRSTVAVALGLCAVVVGSVIAERHGVVIPHLDPGNTLNAAVAACSAIFVTSLVLGVALRLIERHHAEARHLERARDQAQRLEGLGRLAGGVAHDLNNILAPVVAAELLTDEPGLSPEAREQIVQITEAGKRATALTGQLLAFARRGSSATEIDLNRVIEEFAPLLRRLLPHPIELVLELAPGLPPVQAARSDLEQVILNLVTNARDATPESGGRIVVTTSLELREAATRELPGGRYLQLEVRDQGSGMPPEVQAQLFEPFFTTKGERGTGLGLATVYGIVKRSGGAIAVESAPGRGATFRVVIPVADGAPSAAVRE